MSKIRGLYTVVKKWKDDGHVEVMEHFSSLVECYNYIDKQEQSNLFDWLIQ